MTEIPLTSARQPFSECGAGLSPASCALDTLRTDPSPNRIACRLMVCASCGRRVDPNRSFCTNCGSSVFVEEGEQSSFRPFASAMSSASASASESAKATLRSLQRSAESPSAAFRSFQRSARSFERAAARRAVTARSAAPAFRLGPLIRFAVVVFLVWTAASWLLDIPEIVALKEAIQHGRLGDDEVRAARDAVRARLDAVLGRTHEAKPNATPPAPPLAPRDSTPTASRESTPSAPGRPTSADERRALPAPSGPNEWSNVRVSPAPAAARLPPGVSLTGNGVSLPRVLHLVQPKYTPQAERAKIEGTVVLYVVVRTHGEPGEITVVRSLDPDLDAQAIVAVRQWRFAPGQRGGRPVPVLVQIAVPFSLR
jgi:TonB family protein